MEVCRIRQQCCCNGGGKSQIQPEEVDDEQEEMKGNGRGGKQQSEKLSGRRRASMEKLRRFPKIAWEKMWAVGKENPRRVIHALKVGLALTLVSMLYLLEPLFEGIGHNSMWAVMTVVVVLEFTAGATLCKGMNRGLGTLGAASLAFLIEFVANKTGRVFRAVFIAVAVFLIGATSTYIRFIPYIKKNYDYGVLVFLLTFNLITVSSYRVHNVLKIAHERLYTIAIGCGICLFMSLFIFPNWSGEDLHNSTVSKIEGLATSIKACINQYFQFNQYLQEADIEAVRSKSSKDIHKGYRAVLESKVNEESLALFASWEPRQSRLCRWYPWQQYVKLGAALRHFGYTAIALHGCLESEIQTPRSVRAMFKNPCIRVADEVSKVLMQLADSIRNRRRCSPNVLSDNLQEALQDLNSAIKSQPRLFLGSNHVQANNILAVAAAAERKHDKDYGRTLSSVKTDTTALREWRTKRVDDQSKESERKVLRPQLSKIAITSLEFSEALPFAAFTSLLVEIVVRLELVIEEVELLGKMACFKQFVEQSDIEIVQDCEKIQPKKNRHSDHGTNVIE